MEVTTGPEDNGKGNQSSDPFTDFDWVLGALCFALVEELTMEDLEYIIADAKSGEEFDAGVTATIWLKDIVRGDNEIF